LIYPEPSSPVQNQSHSDLFLVKRNASSEVERKEQSPLCLNLEVGSGWLETLTKNFVTDQSFRAAKEIQDRYGRYESETNRCE